MDRFVSRYESAVAGVLSGFDRVVFRGILQRLIRTLGMYYFLTDSGIRLLDFVSYAKSTSARIKRMAEIEAKEFGRPLRYLSSGSESKEDVAREVLRQHPLTDGLICTLTTLEPCITFEYERSKDRSERGLKLYRGKCLHIYKYWLDPVFGFMSGRLQTWFPFQIQICINGREWLARQLAENGSIRFKRYRNCFPWISDVPAAQQLMDEQLRTCWPAALNRIAQLLNPAHDDIFRASPMSYYWTAYQTEWATDVMFHSPATLAELYPQLTRLAMLHFKSPDVMRFLAEKAAGNYIGQIVTSFKDRAEGVRIKHWQGGNSIKMYDKAASVLRVETTIANPDEFKVFRPKTTEPDSNRVWLPLRKGVADLHRRAQVSARSNAVYLDALSSVRNTTPCSKIFDAVSRPAFDSRRVRALRLSDPQDLALIETIARGEFSTSGFRNRDIRRHLFPATAATTPDEARRLSAKTGRLLRLLRAHRVIYKLQHSTRYRLTAYGQELAAALFAVRNADITRLLDIAA